MRKLKTGPQNLTVGGAMFAAGTVLSEAEAPKSLVEAANTGRRINGFLLAEWLAEPAKAPEPSLEPADEPDLADLIKTLVGEGESKSSVCDSLGSSERFTHREVRAEFDRLLAAGEIVKGENPGEYSVA